MTIKPYDRQSVEKFLTDAGWVISKVRAASFGDAVEDFQRAYNLGPAIKADRIPGPETVAAMAESKRQGYRLSKHFTARELRCGCKGKSMGCRSIRATRKLLIGLEKVRAKGYAKKGLKLTTAYRCAVYNKRVGGIAKSRHLEGNAVDIPRVLKASQIDPAWDFRGIGVTGWDRLIPGINNRRVVHLDVGEPRRIVFQE